MSSDNDSTTKDEEKTSMAEERTDLAEDRTLLAIERTFAGWTRTAFASIGLGLAFQAIFQKIEPNWVPKLIASAFICLGILIIWKAERRTVRVRGMQEPHTVEAVKKSGYRTLAIVVSLSAVALLVCIWFLF